MPFRPLSRSFQKILLALLFGCTGILLTGCGGLNASHSFSPLDFFLPAHGLLDARTNAAPAQATVIAQANSVTAAEKL